MSKVFLYTQHPERDRRARGLEYEPASEALQISVK